VSVLWPALLFAFGGLCLLGWGLLVRAHVQPRQPIPGLYQALAWLGIVAMWAAVCWAVAVAIRL
jgi:hypothetical protein